jgi:predicted dehydrogenase
MTDIYSIGVIGAGTMGIRMIEALRQHGRFEPGGVFDPDPAAVQRALAAAPGMQVADSAEALARLPGLDALYIASPPAWHLAHMRAALAHRLPVLCEKPLASSIADAGAIAALAAGSAAPCAVNFPYARAAAALRLGELAHSGALGQIGQATVTLRFARWPRAWQEGAATWLAGPEQGGFTREVLSHFLFLAMRLFGPLQLESSSLERAAGQTETRLAARLGYAGGTLEVDAAVEGDIIDNNRFAVHGSLGSAAITDWYRLEAPGQPPLEPASPTPATLDAFARMLDGQPGHGLATVDEALAVAQLAEALLDD